MLIARILAISLVGIAALAVPPDAVAHEGGGLVVIAEPDHGPRGATLTVTGDDFFPGHALDIRFVVRDASETIGSATVGDDGHFSVEVRIPPGAPVGAAAIDVVTPAGIVGRVIVTVDPGPVVGPAETTPVADPSSASMPDTIVIAIVIAIAAPIVVALLLSRGSRRESPHRTR